MKSLYHLRATRGALALCAGCVLFGVVSINAKRGDLFVELRFTPTTATGSAAPTIASAALARPLSFEVLDERPEAERSIVGQGTDDDDTTFAVRTNTSLANFATDTLTRLAGGWGLRISKSADLTLRVSVAKWFVFEQNQAVGATYAAEVGLRGELTDLEGKNLWRGFASGDARRYGKKQRPENHNEVMSDAAQEALSNLLSSPDLHMAIAGKVPQDAVEPGVAAAALGSSNTEDDAVSPDELLEDLKHLQEKDFSTEFLAGYVEKKRFQRSLTTDDLVKWKEAGIPEAVISAALERSAKR